jgi:hypothetical protein
MRCSTTYLVLEIRQSCIQVTCCPIREKVTVIRENTRAVRFGPIIPGKSDSGEVAGSYGHAPRRECPSVVWLAVRGSEALRHAREHGSSCHRVRNTSHPPCAARGATREHLRPNNRALDWLTQSRGAQRRSDLIGVTCALLRCSRRRRRAPLSAGSPRCVRRGRRDRPR